MVSNENKAKAEDAIKKDDLVNRGSIAIKSASSLEIDKEGYFIIYDGNEEQIKQLEGLLKELAEKFKDAEKVLEKYDEQENSAIEGMGNILG